MPALRTEVRHARTFEPVGVPKPGPGVTTPDRVEDETGQILYLNDLLLLLLFFSGLGEGPRDP